MTANLTRRCAIVDLPHIGTVTAAREVVIPTGGGYFVSPSISALRDVLAVAPGG